MTGQILGTHYKLQQELGRRAGRRTLLCSEQATGKLVVVKLLAFNSDFEWDDLKLFEREAEALKSLSHPAIPRYLDYFEVSSDLIGFALVQSYIPAQSLQEYVEVGRRFTETEIKEIAKAILEILIYLHEQKPSVIHRDLKPSNILLGDRSGNSVGNVYLVDFGSVQTVAAQEGATRTVVGTYGYMPPEQFGGRTVPASDLYALGATLIYLITGVHPVDLPQKDFRIQFEHKANLSSGFSNWLRQMLEPNLERRFNSAYKALQALNQCHVNIEQPSNRIQIKKTSEYLEIRISPKRFDFGDFLVSAISGWFFLVIGIITFLPLLVGNIFLGLLTLLFIYAGFSLIYENLFYFVNTKLHISEEKITLNRKLFNFIKINFNHSSPREDINKLVYFPEYIRERNDEFGREVVSAQIEIWVGIYKYKLPGTSIKLSEQEVKGLARELSSWLDLRLSIVSR